MEHSHRQSLAHPWAIRSTLNTMSRNYQNHPERYLSVASGDPHTTFLKPCSPYAAYRPDWWPEDKDLGEEDSELDLI